MKLSKLKLYNYRCFGDEEQIIDIDNITAFIGNNSTGKTAALLALNCIFSNNSNDRILKRSDFHLPKGKNPDELNAQFLEEKGVSILGASVRTQWKNYDSDTRYSNAQLRFNSTDIDASIKKSEIVFLPTVTGKECTIDDMSDGLRSLFYISLVDSILDVESKIREEIESDTEHMSFNYKPPILTIIALEEPENHIAPHLIGQLIFNLENIASKNNAQTVLTSHSTAIIKRIDPENLRYFRLEANDCTTRIKAITLPDKEKLADQYKFIKEAVKAYPELYFAKLVILGEGDSEEIILPKFWSAKNGNLDASGISIVPLGGRHVNHFWRLLNDLNIPHITLLDLDKERDGGGWGRIKYVLDQLIQNGVDRNKLLKIKNGIMTDEELEGMLGWNVKDADALQSWIDYLEIYSVFFSSPLDIDFLMLEHYGEVYKEILGEKEGPRLMVNIGGKRQQKYIKSIETLGESYPEYEKRIIEDVQHALKEFGEEGITYTEEQKKLMVWYTYFFLNRGKPSTHIEALSKIEDKSLIASMPTVFSKIIAVAEKKLQGDVL